MSSLLPRVDRTEAQPTPAPDLSRIHHFTVRQLNENDGGAFKAIRLEALQVDGRYFGASYEEEAKLTSEQWRQRCRATEDHCIFGLLNNDKLIGVLEATKWPGDKEGKTVLWGAAYVNQNYREKGAATPLYVARLAWSKQRAQFNAAVFFIREGNRRSKEIHEKQGAIHTHDEPKRWADGTMAMAHWYRTELRP